MSKQKLYRRDDVCKALNISIYTLQKWYQWERYALQAGDITERYLPVPERISDLRGKPNVWTELQLRQLKEYQKSIILGRHGQHGKYSNPDNKDYVGRRMK